MVLLWKLSYEMHVKNKPPYFLLGEWIRKKFGNVWYNGRVSYQRKAEGKDFLRVVYGDGDTEDMPIGELSVARLAYQYQIGEMEGLVPCWSGEIFTVR